MKKYLLSLAISCSLFLAAQAQSGGNGTAGNPYQIKNCNDLQAMNLHKGSYWKMMNDVDCSATKTGTGQWGTNGFVPVGDSIDRFIGNFNGNCFAVENLYINDPAKNFVGLFGYTDSSAWIQGAEILNSDISGKDYTGIVIGYKLSTYMDDCFTTGKINGGNYTGGVVGASDNFRGTYSQITNSSSEATVNGKECTGGIVGKITTYQGGASYVTNCFSTGNVTGTTATGGIAGNCSTYQGGGAQLQYCYSTGAVNGTDSTGGLVGVIGPYMGGGSNIVQSYFTGSVSGHNSVGGLAGFSGAQFGGGSQMQDSYTMANVTGNANVGGLCGTTSSTPIDTCYAIGIITGSSNVGGFVGSQSGGSYATCYWDSSINLTLHSIGNAGNAAGVKPSGTIQMETQATYVSWNFVNEWMITAGYFPTLYPSPTNGTCNFPTTLTAAYDYTPDSTCTGDTVWFYDRSLGSPTAWLWNFDDPASGPNNTSTLQNPKHTFTLVGWYTVKEVVSVGVNKDSIISPIHIYCGVTGTNQIEQMQSVKVYPNPSNGHLTITTEGISDKLSVEVYNVLGERVYNSGLSTQNAVSHLDLSSQPAGMYMYRVLDSKGTLIDSGKLVIE